MAKINVTSETCIIGQHEIQEVTSCGQCALKSMTAGTRSRGELILLCANQGTSQSVSEVDQIFFKKKW